MADSGTERERRVRGKGGGREEEREKGEKGKEGGRERENVGFFSVEMRLAVCNCCVKLFHFNQWEED